VTLSGPRRARRRRNTAAGPLAAARRLEPFLVLLAAPGLLLTERFGLPALWAGTSWLAALWVLRRVVDGRWGRPLVIDAPVLALLATVPLAVAAAADRTAAVSRASSLLFAVAVAYAVANALGTARRAWRLAGWLLLGASAMAVVGALGAEWPDKVAVVGDLAARLPRLLPAIPHAVFGRTAGTAAGGVHPNMLAGLLVPFVPLAAACLAWPRRPDDRRTTPSAAGDRRRMPNGVRMAASLALATTLPVLALTQSRGAWLALAVAMAWLGAVLLFARSPAARGLRRPAAPWLAAAGLVALLAAGWWLTAAGGRAPTGSPAAAAAPGELDLRSRLGLWSASAALVAEHPATGIGLHQFALRYGQAPGVDYYVFQGYAHAHNQLLQAALDYGLPGLVAVAGLYAALAVAAWRARRYTAGTPLDALVVGATAGLLAHALHGLVDAVAIGAKPGFTTWALIGLLAGARARARAWVGPAPEVPLADVNAADAP